MTSYKTIYLICIILCLMGYSDSGKTSGEQQLCKKNIQEDFGCSTRSLTRHVLLLPKWAFKKKTLDQFKTNYGISYFMKILEKAATSLTESPREFCDKRGMNKNFPPTLCMEQLHEVYHITNEYDALPVIKWTYVNIIESNIPKKFHITNKDDEVKHFKHFAYAYFEHMVYRLDVYVSLPKAVTFCQNQEPSIMDRGQNYRNVTDENRGESSGREMTVKEVLRIQKRRRQNNEPNTSSSDD